MNKSPDSPPIARTAEPGGALARGRRAVTVVLLACMGVLATVDADAQTQRRPSRPPPETIAPGAPGTPGAQVPQSSVPGPSEVRETVQADVSSRSVAVTSGFTGTEIIVFGAVDNSRQASAESGFYDIVIVVEGTPTRLVARRKSNDWGIWLNATSITFQSVPSYYAIVSTRPLDEIADTTILRDNDIGFEQVRMTPISGWESGVSTADLEEFKSSVVRLKQRERLYVEQPVGVAFIGRSLFRASVNLPANVPVGPLVARVHLFREGRMLHTFRSRVTLRREGLENLLHTFAFGYPLFYGLATVLLSMAAGIAATAAFRRGGH